MELGCILSKFYIKPQPFARVRELLKGCILSKFYIKPQQQRYSSALLDVVSYRNSTSNHNRPKLALPSPLVVSYRNSTSNHNITILRSVSIMLYLIEILHQTTTVAPKPHHTKSCILSKFYIKPQHGARRREASRRCILSKFYIKPQHLPAYSVPRPCCILSKFYIKPQQHP